MRKALPGLAVLLFLSTSARADLSFTSTLAGSQNAANPGDAKTKISIKGDTTRTELSLLGNAMVILTWANGDGAQIDMVNRIYTVRTAAKAAEQPTNFMGGPMQTVVAIKNLGMQTFKGAKVPHWRLDFETSNSEGTDKTSVELWSSTTPFPAPINSKMPVSEDSPVGFRALIAGNAVVKDGLKGMAAVFATVPLRTVTLIDGQPRATFEIGDVSSADLPGKLFQLPDQFEQISRDEWNKRENEFIRKKMEELQGGAAPAVTK